MIEKNAFREFVSGLQVGSTISVRFTGGTLKNRAGQTVCRPGTTEAVTSGEYTFLGTKTGRGKGGSLLLRMSLPGEPEIAFGTPELASVVGIGLVGSSSILGYQSESDMPESCPPRPEYAARLKQACMTILPLTGNVSITLRSTDPRLNGTFSVVEAHRHVGRHGQVSLKLSDAAGNLTEFWTYRHSGVVDNISISG